MASHAELSQQGRDAQHHYVRTRETRRNQAWIGMESINRIADTAACDADHAWRIPKKVMTPPTDLGARIDRYRCCLPALAGFSI